MYRGALYYTWVLTWVYGVIHGCVVMCRVYGDVQRYIVRYRGAWCCTWTYGDAYIHEFYCTEEYSRTTDEYVCSGTYVFVLRD